MRSTLLVAWLKMGKTRKNCYGVRVGRNVGVFNTWEECQAQIDKYPGAVFKGFSNPTEAHEFAFSSNSSHARSTYGGPSSHSSSNRLSRTQQRKRHQEKESNSSGIQLPSSISHTLNRPLLHLVTSSDYTKSSSTTSMSSSLHSTNTTSCTDTCSSRSIVYTDGCCFNNGKTGASAGIGVYWGLDSPHNISEKLSGAQTNQRAELVSAYKGIQSAIDQGHSAVEVRTDSSYTIKAMTEWLKGWKKNGWKTCQSKPVKNKDDIVLLDTVCQKIDVKWTHVPAHQGIEGNEAADRLAKAGSFK